MRDRAVVKQPMHGGTCFATTLKEMKACNVLRCDADGNVIVSAGAENAQPRDCALGEWGDWSGCSVSCGSAGTQERQRAIERYADFGGKVCEGALTEIKNCGSELPESCFTPAAEADAAGMIDVHGKKMPATEATKINCEWEEKWSEWSPCSKTCGSGATKTRTRKIKVHPNYMGDPCEERASKEVASCDLELADCECGPCEYGEWSAWSACHFPSLTRVRKRDPKVAHYCLKGCTGVREQLEACTFEVFF